MKHSLTGGSNAHIWWYCPGSVYLNKVVPVVETEAMKEGTRLHEEAATCIIEKQLSTNKIVSAYLHMLPVNFREYGWLVEHTVYSGQWDEAFATLDLGWEDKNTPNVCDLKTGKTPVDVKNNEQLLTCAYWYSSRKPILHIAQPKVCNHLMTWEPTDEEWEAAKKQIDWALDSVYNGPVVLKTGDHCRKCRARDFCPEKKKQNEQPW